MGKLIIISDIDDVVRDLGKNIKYSLNLYYHGENWGDYHYKNHKVIEFFRWYIKQPFSSELFDNCDYNIEYIEYLNSLDNIELHFLSSNSNKKARITTINDLKLLFGSEIEKNIHFVDSWNEKYPFVVKNKNIFGSDLNKMIFIDDRPDSCLMFHENGIRSYWYQKYMSTKSINKWCKNNNKFYNIPCGETNGFKNFLNINITK